MSLICPHQPPCPGCPRLGQEGVAPGAVARIEALCSEHGLATPEVMIGARTGFRRRARLAVRGRSASPRIGIFEAGTHRVVDIPKCRVHHPLINEVALELKAAIHRTGTQPYADAAHCGLVRYVQIAVDSARRAQVALVTNDVSPASAEPLLTSLRSRLGSRLSGLWWNGQPERSNRIFGDRFEHVFGERAFIEAIGGANIHFLPGAFQQSHLDLSHALVRRIHAWVPPGAPVVELYAGAGAIGLGLAARGHQVTFNELSPPSLESLELGLEALPREASARTRVIAGPASATADVIHLEHTVIVDPPRKGLDRSLRDSLLAAAPERLLYVACGLRSFLDDARALSARFRLAEVVVYDFFPHTEHLEVAARFERDLDSAQE